MYRRLTTCSSKRLVNLAQLQTADVAQVHPNSGGPFWALRAWSGTTVAYLATVLDGDTADALFLRVNEALQASKDYLDLAAELE